jgi:dienelactone hydrolase
MTRTLLSLCLCVATSGVGSLDGPAPAQNTPALWADLEPGSHAVGFQQMGAGRTVSVWYPTSGGGAAMMLRDYYGEDAAARYRKFLSGAGISSDGVDAMFGAAMAARRGAEPLAGPFPVILIGQGNAQEAADQAVLAEYLTSHGYLVATTSSPMATRPMASEAEVGPFAERQARELQDALNLLGARPAADVSRTAAVGHSFGARAALLLAMRDSRVRAIVSLDGGIGTATAIDSFTKAESFDRPKATAPILHYYERLDAFMTPDFTLLESLPAPLTAVQVTGMHHMHFTTLGFVAAMIPEFAAATGADADVRASAVRVARGTLAFVREKLGVGAERDF